MSDPDNPELNFQLLRVLHSALLVVLDETQQHVYAWHGGSRVQVFSYEGLPIDEFDACPGTDGYFDVYDVQRTVNQYRRQYA